MKLLTKEIRQRSRELGPQDIADPLVIAKYFTPWTGWTWYLTYYDPQDELAFGWVVGFERELGYFSIEELESIRGPGGLGIERDLYWDEKPLSAVKQFYARRGYAN